MSASCDEALAFVSGDMSGAQLAHALRSARTADLVVLRRSRAAAFGYHLPWVAKDVPVARAPGAFEPAAQPALGYGVRFVKARELLQK